MRLFPLAAALALLAPLAPAPATGAASCPQDLPVADAFDSRGLFAFTLGAGTGPGLADAARVTGPTLVCREPIEVPQECFSEGSAALPPIRTEILQMQLVGTTASGFPVTARESPVGRSSGLVGPSTVACDFDPRSGKRHVEFSQPLPSFFDVWIELELPVAGPQVQDKPFRVEATLCGLPPGPEGIEPCQPPPYRHAGGAGFAAGPGIPPTIHSNPSCHMPFFVPGVPPPAACSSTGGTDAQGRLTGATFRVFVSEMGSPAIVNVRTASIHADASHVARTASSPWRDGNGVWWADIAVVPLPTAPLCTSGQTTPITVKAELQRPTGQEPITLGGEYCLTP